jgi:predicted phage baseplate assembly protein
VSAPDTTIDTLTFEDIVRLALADLPGASQGEWTVHGPIDPGITLLELFAWQFEQRLFMADQLTEPIVRASLRLLGLPGPAPALPASTVLSVRATGSARLLPAGTVFGLKDDPDGRRFALDCEVWVLPVTGVRSAGRLLSSGDELELTLESDAATAVGESELSLLVEVAAAPGVAPAWRSGAVDVDAPAQLRWEAIGPDGAAAPVEVKDSTGAFRRSGILRLAWPAVWDRPGPGARRLRATAVSATYTEAVRILAVHPNAAIARHRVPGHLTEAQIADINDRLRGFLPLPGQVLRVPGAAGLLWDGDGDGDVVLSVTERSGERHDWHGVRTWVGSGPGDRVFLVDRARGDLRFGDGRSGRILRPAAAPEALLRYALGAGRQGNLGEFRGWAEADGATVAVNPVAAGDGAEQESLETARQRSADALAARDRTVTEQDTRGLAETTPGLGLRRAHVSPGFHPAFPCDPVPGALAVTIVPHADRAGEPGDWTAAPQPDAGALATTRTRLARARLLGQEICVLAPVYRRVTVDVAVTATAQPGDNRQRIVDALRRYLDPLAGGSEHGGWPFGRPVRPSALAGVVQETIGPEATVTSLSATLDGGPPSDCADLAIGPRELVWLEAATITWVAALPAGGGLR